MSSVQEAKPNPDAIKAAEARQEQVSFGWRSALRPIMSFREYLFL